MRKGVQRRKKGFRGHAFQRYEMTFLSFAPTSVLTALFSVSVFLISVFLHSLASLFSIDYWCYEYLRIQWLCAPTVWNTENNFVSFLCILTANVASPIVLFQVLGLELYSGTWETCTNRQICYTQWCIHVLNRLWTTAWELKLENEKLQEDIKPLMVSFIYLYGGQLVEGIM